MIVNLSYPRGPSVNDCIPSSLCSVSYRLVNDAVDYILELGRFTQMVKFDLKSTYRILPIYPCDQSVLGVSWEFQVYLDHCLPFGLCSAPKIFTAVADTLAWVLHQAGVRYIIHYFNDFLFFGSPLSDEGSQALTTALETLVELRIPVSLPKLEGPSTLVTFYGIVLDLAQLELRLLLDKVERIRGLVSSWLGRRSGHRSDLESLLGHLSHAAVVVKPGLFSSGTCSLYWQRFIGDITLCISMQWSRQTLRGGTVSCKIDLVLCL